MKNKFSIRKLIYNDKYLIMISVVAAVIFWIATSIAVSPETTKTITVPVTVSMEGTLAESLGIEYYGNTNLSVEVTVSCQKYVAKDITSDSITASLQTSNVTSSGYCSVPISVQPALDSSDFKIESFYPTTIESFYDTPLEKTMNIDLNYLNNDFVADGYVLGQVTLSEETAIIKGPKTYVNMVASLQADIALSNDLKESQIKELSPVALDVEGNEVNYVQVTSNVSANIPILKVENLSPKVNFINAPKNVEELFDIKYSEDSIDVGIVEGTKDLVIGDIDFSQVGIGKNKFEFDLENISGVRILDGTKTITVTINVPNTYTKKVIPIKSSNVVINTPEGYNATVNSLSKYSVVVIGKEEVVSNLNSDNISLTCDLLEENIETGSNKYPINATVSSDGAAWVYNEYFAYINVSQ